MQIGKNFIFGLISLTRMYISKIFFALVLAVCSLQGEVFHQFWKSFVCYLFQIFLLHHFLSPTVIPNTYIFGHLILSQRYWILCSFFLCFFLCDIVRIISVAMYSSSLIHFSVMLFLLIITSKEFFRFTTIRIFSNISICLFSDNIFILSDISHSFTHVSTFFTIFFNIFYHSYFKVSI